MADATPSAADLLFAALGSPPYFARLEDPRTRLTSAQWNAYPQLRRLRYFVVVEHQLDRDEEHPGIWLRPLLGQPAELENLHCPPFLLQNGLALPTVTWQLEREPHEPVPLWLNLDWCSVQQVHSIN